MPDLKKLFVGSLLLFAAAWAAQGYAYKFVGATLPETHAAPVQAELKGPAKAPGCCKGDYCYEFEPLYDYEAAALVFGVSHKLTSRFGAVFPADAGLLWGRNSSGGYFRGVKLKVLMDHYWVWVPAGRPFNLDEAANTHLASCDPAAFAAIKKIAPGDQVRVRGRLVDVRASERPGETDPSKILTWRTSVTREDTGEGSCEIVYVSSPSDIEILKAGPRWLVWLKWLGASGMLLAAALWQRKMLLAAKELAAE